MGKLRGLKSQIDNVGTLEEALSLTAGLKMKTLEGGLPGPINTDKDRDFYIREIKNCSKMQHLVTLMWYDGKVPEYVMNESRWPKLDPAVGLPFTDEEDNFFLVTKDASLPDSHNLVVIKSGIGYALFHGWEGDNGFFMFPKLNVDKLDPNHYSWWGKKKINSMLTGGKHVNDKAQLPVMPQKWTYLRLPNRIQPRKTQVAPL